MQKGHPLRLFVSCMLVAAIYACTKHDLPYTTDQYAQFEQNLKQYVRFDVGRDDPRLQFTRSICSIYFRQLFRPLREINPDAEPVH